MASTEEEKIKEGDYVIIQRHDFMKIHKLAKKTTVNLGKDEIDIAPIIGEPFWSTFKMEPKGKRSFLLNKCNEVISLSDEIIKDITSGEDNRDIVDDGSSQKLSSEEIVNLRACGVSAQGIVSQLVENSKTFMNKTEYSQVKYLKKKEKKYFEYITIKKPTFRLIAEILMKQPAKILGMRMDTLAQLTTLANVHAGGTYLLYETGCSGIAAAAIIDRLGSNGTIIHVHPGNSEHPSHAVLSLNLKKEQLDQLISINIHKLSLKNTKQNESEETVIEKIVDDEKVTLGKRKLEEPNIGWRKKRKEENEERAIEILKEKKADALLIVGREHPSNIFRKLIRYVKISRPFVIYCSIREPLQEMFCELKSRSDVIALRLTESWLRGYQVLPDRTHPDINISGSGGFLLSGIVVTG